MSASSWPACCAGWPPSRASPSTTSPASRPGRAETSGVGFGAGIAPGGAQLESAEVCLPALAVVIALVAVGEVVMAQHDAGAVLLGAQRDDYASGPGRDGGVVGTAPGVHLP